MTKSFCIFLIACALADDEATEVKEVVADATPDTAVVEAEQLAAQMSVILARLKEIPTEDDMTSVPINKVDPTTAAQEKK